MHLAPHLLLERRNVVHVVSIPVAQWWEHLAPVFFRTRSWKLRPLWIIPPKFLLRRRLVVVREVTQEEEGQHLVAEVVRIHGPAQLVSDAPEGLAQLFLVGIGHGKSAVGVWGRLSQRLRGDTGELAVFHDDQIRIGLDGGLPGRLGGAAHRGGGGSQIGIFGFLDVFHGRWFSPHSSRVGLSPALPYLAQASTADL